MPFKDLMPGKKKSNADNPRGISISSLLSSIPGFFYFSMQFRQGRRVVCRISGSTSVAIAAPLFGLLQRSTLSPHFFVSIMAHASL